MNHFLALRLADDPRDRLAAVADRLQAWQLPASWVHPDDYHLTVAFLGAVDADEARYLPYSIASVAGSLRRPQLRFSGLGASGGRTEPRVVYTALDDPEQACAGIHRDLCDCLGMEPERQFMPHVSICRPRSATPRDLAGAANRSWPLLLEAHGLADWGPCPTTDLVLYRTQPERGTRYQEVQRWPLIAA